jgi:hypothetical protein
MESTTKMKGSRFSVSGTVSKAASGRSLQIEIVNRTGKDYVSIKDLEDVIAGRKESVMVWRPNLRGRY